MTPKSMGVEEEKVGVIAGAFPLLHPGYINLLEECKDNCSRLIVFLHTDPSLSRATKAKPLFSINERTRMLLSLRGVAEVFPYDGESDLYNLLKTMAPDIRFLGTDYKDKAYTGEGLDIPIHWVDRSHGWSTTKMINLIKQMP